MCVKTERLSGLVSCLIAAAAESGRSGEFPLMSKPIWSIKVSLGDPHGLTCELLADGWPPEQQTLPGREDQVQAGGAGWWERHRLAVWAGPHHSAEDRLLRAAVGTSRKKISQNISGSMTVERVHIMLFKSFLPVYVSPETSHLCFSCSHSAGSRCQYVNTC